jgi:hypothetical protein
LFLSSWHGTLLSRALALGKVSLNSEPFCIRVQLTGYNHRENGGAGEPKLPGKVSGDILVDLSVTSIDLRSPHGGSRAKLLCVAAALLGAMVVTMLPLRAEVLSCRWPKRFYILDCEGGKCLPLFLTDFAPELRMLS